MYSINCPTDEDRPHVREYEANLVEGKMLKATANYNLAADPASCVGGQPHEVYPGLGLAVLSVRTGDMIKFIRMTGF